MMRHLHTENLRAYKPTSSPIDDILARITAGLYEGSGKIVEYCKQFVQFFYKPLLQMTVSLRLGVFELLLPFFSARR